MKLKIEVERCVGHGMCARAAPKLIRLNEDGYNTTPSIDVASDQEVFAERAVKACPEGIISLVHGGKSTRD